MSFKNAEEVELVFGITLTSNQYILVENYIQNGVRPDPDGCMGCDAGFVRKLTSDMDRYDGPWPWHGDDNPRSAPFTEDELQFISEAAPEEEAVAKAEPKTKARAKKS